MARCSVKSVPRHVAVLLNQWRVDALPGEGYEPLAGYIKAIEFFVDATSPEAACEVAYGVTNSELTDHALRPRCTSTWCGPTARSQASDSSRSMTCSKSTGVRFVCARFGFIRVPV